MTDDIPDFGTPSVNYGANENISEGDEEATGASNSFRAAAESIRTGGFSMVSPSNMLISIRDLEFIHESAKEYDLVPSMEGENIALVPDENLLYTNSNAGQLYYSEKSFYNKANPPEYVITCSPYIYRHVLSELDQSKSVPCGLYFCCQGGEFGAHVGSSHDEDVVDIRLAYVLLALFFLSMIILSTEYSR